MNRQLDYIPVSQRFERDMDANIKTAGAGNPQYFPRESEITYLFDDILSPVPFFKEGQEDSALFEFINNFYTHKYTRVKVLEDYFSGRNTTILSYRRRKTLGSADYRIPHTFASDIVMWTVPYAIGEPVSISYKDSIDSHGNDDIADVLAISNINNLDTLDMDLATDAAVYGLAYEIHYRKDMTDRIARVGADEMFTVYNTSFDRQMIYAVHCPVHNDHIYITLYTTDEIIELEPIKFGPSIKKEDVAVKSIRRHLYGEVPVVEWRNNSSGRSDFQNEIPKIDAYDAAVSDTANYTADFNDSILVIQADLESIDMNFEKILKMKTDTSMIVLDSNGTSPTSVDFISKSYDHQGAEAHKQRLKNDIYESAGIPIISNLRSGQKTAKEIELTFSKLEQNRRQKVSQYKSAMIKRWRLVSHVHEELKDEPINYENLLFTFKNSNITDKITELESLVEMGAEISQETILDGSTITDYSTERARLDAERF